MPKVTRRRAKSDPLMCQKWPWRLKGLYCEGPFISPGFVLACRRARFPIREALTRHKDQTEAEKTCTHTQSNIKQQKVGRKQCRQQNTCFCFLFGGGGGAPLRALRWSKYYSIPSPRWTKKSQTPCQCDWTWKYRNLKTAVCKLQ